MWFKTFLAALVEAIRQTWPSIRDYVAGLATAKGIELYHDNKSLKKALDASRRISDIDAIVDGMSDYEVTKSLAGRGLLGVDKSHKRTRKN
jgi:hypothetical protein